MEIVHYYYPRQISHFQNESRQAAYFAQKSNNPKEFNIKTFAFTTKQTKYWGFRNKSGN